MDDERSLAHAVVDGGDPKVNWEHRVVLITGGTGSLGTAVADQLLLEPIRALRILSRNEHDQESFARQHKDERIRMLIGDVRDAGRMHRAMNGVDVVIHCAALKSVPLIEENVPEAVRTNIIGTENVMDAAIDRGVTAAMLISTDKAVNPCSVYGATKLVAEQMWLRPYSGNEGPTFGAVRLGNLIGSRGSIVPLIMEQRKTGVVDLTDPRMSRYWMTLSEGARFVIEHVGQEGLFTPTLPSVWIRDVLTAIAPEARVRIVGVRAGERLSESLRDGEDSAHNDDWMSIKEIKAQLE